MTLLVPKPIDRWVTFDAPSEAWYEDALEVLRRKGYREWSRMSPKRLKARTFTQRRPTLRLYWVEPKQPQQTMARRLKQFVKTLEQQPKYRHLL